MRCGRLSRAKRSPKNQTTRRSRARRKRAAGYQVVAGKPPSEPDRTPRTATHARPGPSSGRLRAVRTRATCPPSLRAVVDVGLILEGGHGALELHLGPDVVPGPLEAVLADLLAVSHH